MQKGDGVLMSKNRTGNYNRPNLKDKAKSGIEGEKAEKSLKTQNKAENSGVNIVCSSCAKSCKQTDLVVVVRCPLYQNIN